METERKVSLSPKVSSELHSDVSDFAAKHFSCEHSVPDPQTHERTLPPTSLLDASTSPQPPIIIVTPVSTPPTFDTVAIFPAIAPEPASSQPPFMLAAMPNTALRPPAPSPRPASQSVTPVSDEKSDGEPMVDDIQMLPHAGQLQWNPEVEEGGDEHGEAGRVLGRSKFAFFRVCVLCIGVIYGDIGTSPIYTAASLFTDLSRYSDTITAEDAYGIASLMVWSLTLVPSIKYCVIVLRATLKGQGGTFTLLALLEQDHVAPKLPPWLKSTIVPVSLVGVALLLGDGVITPSISVISAIEGLQAQVPSITRDQIVGISIGILGVLYLSQRYGTGRIGFAFGPICVVWFLTIGLLGIYYIAHEPSIFKALNPWEGVNYFVRHGGQSFSALGFVILTVTGSEALYADMGQFGIRAVRFSWFLLVYPALVLQYLGQCAMVLHNLSDQDSAQNIFFAAIPTALFWPVFVVTTLATITASQATITGSFVILSQAVHLSYFPRLNIVHTSRKWWSRIYIPALNFFLMASTLTVTAAFNSSANLTLMYGLTISLIMIITTLIMACVMHYVWEWHPVVIGAIVTFYLFIDGLFIAATVEKIATGGWLPVCFAGVVAVLLNVYREGHRRAHECEDSTSELVLKHISALSHDIPPTPFKLQPCAPPVFQLMGSLIPLRDSSHVCLQKVQMNGVRKLSVFLTHSLTHVPLAFMRMIERIAVFPDQLLLLQVSYLSVPYAPPGQRIAMYHAADFGGPQWLHAAVVRVGFAEQREISVEAIVEQYIIPQMSSHPAAPSAAYSCDFYVGRHNYRVETGSHFTRSWLKLFSVMTKNSFSITKFLKLPADGTIEIGVIVPLK